MATLRLHQTNSTVADAACRALQCFAMLAESASEFAREGASSAMAACLESTAMERTNVEAALRTAHARLSVRDVTEVAASSAVLAGEGYRAAAGGCSASRCLHRNAADLAENARAWHCGVSAVPTLRRPCVAY